MPVVAMFVRVFSTFAVLALAATASGCGTAPAKFDGSVYRDGKVAFRVGDVPGGWHKVDVDDAALAFRDDRGSSVLVNAQCGLKAEDIPLVALTNQLIMGTTEREYVKEEVLQFDRREARHTILRAKLDGVPLVWDIYVMKKDGCVYDLVFVAPGDRFEQGRDSFERFATGFHTLAEGS